ncbi:MAG TPA: PAS domain S-box protein, partial [Gammaproteobacteria bacterium]
YDDIRTAGAGSVECRMKRKDGRIIDVLLSSSAFNKHDLLRGVTFTLMDISERKSQERKMIEQLDELQRFMKVSVSRENRVKELRDENNQLKASILSLRKGQNK